MKKIFRLIYYRIKLWRYLKKTNSRVYWPIRYWSNVLNIEFGNKVLIRGDGCFANNKECYVKIDDGVQIGKRFTISGLNGRIYIGKKVLIADDVFITQSNHAFDDIDTPIIDQGARGGGNVEIKEGSWIGRQVSILPGVIIGKNCVVGCNSVVTKSIPNYSVAVGNPARVVRRIK